MTPIKFFHVQIIVVFTVADGVLYLATRWTAFFEHTLTFTNIVRLVPNYDYENENVPVFLIFASCSKISGAWPQRTNGGNPRNYLSVKLDDNAPLDTP